MKVVLYILVFMIGFFSCALLISLTFANNVEFPLSFKTNSASYIPSDYFDRSDISVQGDYVIIRVKDASISNYADSGSMRPVIDSSANGIRVQPMSENDVNVGDIISFSEDGHLIVHRVVEKGVDSQGTYFITAGDNNEYSDSKIRFDQVRYKTVGILY